LNADMKTESSLISWSRRLVAGAGSILIVLVTLASLGLSLGRARDPELNSIVSRLEALQTLDRVAFARAEEDVRGLGTNALPAILHLLQARYSWVQREAVALADCLPWFPFTPRPITDRHQAALQACIVLGPTAAPAIESLGALLVDHPSLHVSMALSATGEAALPVICAKLEHADEDTRYFAILALGRIGHGYFVRSLRVGEIKKLENFTDLLPAGAVPALVRNLIFPELRVRAATAWTLGEIRCQAGPVQAGLRRALEDPEPMVRGCAETALQRVMNSALVVSDVSFATPPPSEVTKTGPGCFRIGREAENPKPEN